MRHLWRSGTLRLVFGLLATIGPWGGSGEIEAAGESAFVGLTPCRLVDTRGDGFAGAFGPPALATGVGRDFPLQEQCGIPLSALAVALNVTATNTQGTGFLLLYPQGGVQPLVSTLNYVGGETVANAAIVRLGPGGLTVVAGVSGTDLILDVNGYFTDSLVHAGETSLAVGAGVLVNNTGSSNSALGYNALANNLAANSNTAVGARALFSTTSGSSNTAVGREALATNDTGGFNTAVGFSALSENTVGFFNIALGDRAGRLTTGFGNTLIGHEGVAGEDLTIRLGTQPGHTRTFIAGIRDVTILDDALPVYIDSAGQLGTNFLVPSSRRVKTDIEAVAERSRGLYALRPVSFRYRAHAPGGPVEYGLIAEEVAEVYPELVGRDAEGAPATVRYQVLPTLLLNELQRLAAEKDRQIAELAAAMAELAAEVARLKAQGAAASRDGGR